MDYQAREDEVGSHRLVAEVRRVIQAVHFTRESSPFGAFFFDVVKAATGREETVKKNNKLKKRREVEK